MAALAGDCAECVMRLPISVAWCSLMAVTAFGQHYPFLLVPNSPHGIYAMMQDSKSRLWLGTIDDVYCFDGTNFYSIRQYGYPKETTVGFAEDDAGGIWIATQGTDVGGGSRSGGVYRYQSGRVERILTGDSMSIVRISPEMMLASMGIEADGRPTYGDVYIFRKVDDQWVSERVLDKSASHMTVDHRGWILFPCPGGWCEFNSAQLSSRPAFGAPLQMTRHAGDPLAEKVLRDQFGCVWVRAEIRASYQCPTDENPVQLPSTISKEDSSAHLVQTLICTTIFYGHGLGLFGRVDRVGQFTIVVAIWMLQLVVSPVWLKCFFFGPVEWMWRSRTYLQWEPFL
jgi:hypothetical protein